jgi:hypothetical protein
MHRHRHRSPSVASSTGSNHGTNHGTISSSSSTTFAPEHDESNTNSQLPRIRTTARNYNRWIPRDPTQTDLIINTSAIGRAFPGFDQGNSSDDSMSLEVQRIPLRTQQKDTPTRFPQHHYSDNIASSTNITLDNDNVKVLHTPSPSVMPRRDTRSHKENIPPHTQQNSIQPSSYVSHASRDANGARRAFGDLRARVADTSDNSLQSIDRPASVTHQAKNTRFSTTATTTSRTRTSNLNSAQGSSSRANNGHLNTARADTNTSANNSPSHNANVSTKRQEVEDDLAKRLHAASRTPSKSQITSRTNHTTNSNTINPTQQSFVLPNINETSEVHPGSFRRGTTVPLPGEEQDIYSEIDLLRARCADLQSQLAQTIQQNQQQTEEIRSLKQQLVIKNNHFKLQLEKEQAVTRLAEALKENESWQANNEHLVQEVTELKRNVRHLTRAVSKTDELVQENENLHRQVAHSAKTDRLSEQLQRDNALLKVQVAGSEKHNEELKVQVAQVNEHNANLKVQIAQLDQHNQDLKVHITKLEAENDGHLNGLETREKFMENMTQSTDRELQHTIEQVTRLESKLQRRDKVIDELKKHIQPKSQSSKKHEQSGTRTTRNHTSQSLKQDERAETQTTRQQRSQSLKQDDRSGTQTTHHQRSQSMRQDARPGTQPTHNERSQTFTLDERSGARSTHQEISQTFTLDERTGVTQHDTSQALTQTGPVEESIDSSYASILGHGVLKDLKSSRRNPIQNEDITSGFIIPDISTVEVKAADPHPTLSTNARQVYDSLCKHDCANCTVCSRVASFDTKKQHTIHVPKPVPVSKRMPDQGPYEDAPTVRPSMEPSLALANVIKGLEDEIAHLKMEHSRISTAYVMHDASLGMRQRRSLKKRMDELTGDIETKSDQLYQLYDVVEAQQS